MLRQAYELTLQLDSLNQAFLLYLPSREWPLELPMATYKIEFSSTRVRAIHLKIRNLPHIMLEELQVR